MPEKFVSPLLIGRRTEFNALGFGAVTRTPETGALQNELNELLFRTITELPPAFQEEAASVVSSYSGGDRNFFGLFYVPVWSYLHWAPAAARRAVDKDLLAAAKVAHALSMFLHLWDDHLCDGQLKIDMLRLQLRTVAWRRFEQASRFVCQRAGVPEGMLYDHIADYLDALHHLGEVNTLDAYCRRFARQVGIWTITPRVLGTHLAGPGTAEDLRRTIEMFAIAWRLIDDVQDTHADMMSGQPTAVFIELDQEGRALWEECRARSEALGDLEEESWRRLSMAIHETGCLSRILARIRQSLATAGALARVQGWAGIARELEECESGLR